MLRFLIFIFIIICGNLASSKKICKPSIIKSEKEIVEKLKNCVKGDKLLLLLILRLEVKN